MRHPASTRAGGFTLVEMLISLAITATLLAAMGMAFTAAASAVEMNDRYFRSVQQTRTAMDLMMTEIRRCQAVGVTSSTSITLTSAAGDFSGHIITYAFTGNSITLTDNTAGTTATVASNVTSATFTILNGVNSQNSACVAAIALTMTVQIGQNQVTVSDSAAPRVNLVSLYQ